MNLLSSVVASGTLALALIAAWDSWAKYKAQEPGWKVTCILAIGGLLVSILATISGYIAEADAVAAEKKLEQAEKTAREAKEKTEALDKALAEANLKVGVLSGKMEKRADVLTPDTLALLVKRIGVLPKESLGFVSVARTPETEDFEKKLLGALSQTGVIGPVVRVPRNGRAGDIFGGGGEGSGVVVLHRGEAADGPALIVRDALIEAGIPDIRLVKAPHDLPPERSAILRINDR